MKKTYLLILSILGLIALSLYSTYAMFTADLNMGEIVNFTASTIPTESSILEYERIVIDAGDDKTIDLNITNSTTNSLYYGVWYEMIDPSTISNNITIAKLDTSANPTVGQLNSNNTKTVTLYLINHTDSSIIINIGVGYSNTNDLNLSEGKTIITQEKSGNLDLVSKMRSEAVMDNIASTYVSSSTGINFKNYSSDTNGKGLYIRSGTENDTYPIVYYRGDVDNNLIFADYCWKAIRTTEDNGLKLLYNGVPVNMYESEEKISQSGYTNVVNTTDGYNTFSFDSTNKKWSVEADDETTSLSFSVTEPGIYIMEFDGYVDDENFDKIDIQKNGNSLVYSSGIREDVDNGRIFLGNLSSSDTIKIIADSWEEVQVISIDFSVLKQTGDVVGKSCDNNGGLAVINGESFYNDNNGDNAYVGYMYGTAGSSTYAETHANINDSSIKQEIDDWYEANMTSYTNKLEKVVFCNDRSLYNGTGIGNTATEYGAYGRAYSGAKLEPLMTCPNENNDLFSTSDAIKGNKALTYPIGLLTYDEDRVVGLSYNFYWLGTPGNTGSVFVANVNTYFGTGYNFLSIRPVISLASGFKIQDGDGSVNNPYIVK